MSDNEQGLERLAVAQALYQELGKIVSTRPENRSVHRPMKPSEVHGKIAVSLRYAQR